MFASTRQRKEINRNLLKFLNGANEDSHNFSSTCSANADHRGPHQKVISYSIYGNFSNVDMAVRYLSPLNITINTIPQIYPGRLTANVIKQIVLNKFFIYEYKAGL